MSRSPSDLDLPEARPRDRHVRWIWLIPLAAAAVGIYLGYVNWIQRGPLVTIEFDNAEGLIAGQTQVRYKSVSIGVVQSIRFTDDFSRVKVSARMQNEVARLLTGNAQFWVVRPRLTEGSISGLETIVSGAYVEFDPGPSGGVAKHAFEGLEEPPAIRTGEAGRSFVLRTQRLGALKPGSTVILRDVPVGEVLSVDPLRPDGEVTLRVFIRAPYDGYVQQGSRFWNTSGISANFGPSGLKVEFESLRAVLAGGIAFDTPTDLLDQTAAAEGTGFWLYESKEVAYSASSAKRLEFLTYLQGSASGLGVGSPVEVRGIRVGSVTSVDLVYDVAADRFVVPVRLVVEPGHFVSSENRPSQDMRVAIAKLIGDGYRMQARTSNLLTGQKALSFDQVPEAPPATIRVENGVIVLPAVLGGGDLMAGLGALVDRVDRLPLEKIGNNLNAVLVSLNGVVAGPELRSSLRLLHDTLNQLKEVTRKADHGLSPLFERLPAIANNLDETVRRANATMASTERAYGADSAFSRQASRTLRDVSEASRAVRQLADFLERHPEALISGRDQ